jgi:hypothetical protein
VIPEDRSRESEAVPDEGQTAVAPPVDTPEPTRLMALASRTAVLVTWVALVLVVVALPLAVRSMASTLFREQASTLYDLVAGGEVPPVVSSPPESDETYVNIAVVDLDVMAGEVKLAVSGNRHCEIPCYSTTMTFLALDDSPAQRRGLPPWASISLGPEDRVFSQAVTLPVRGRPDRYPFDTYDLWLGIGVDITRPDGSSVALNRLVEQAPLVITLQSQLTELQMAPPEPIDSARSAVPTDPYALARVDALSFHRPDYLKILAVLLVVLIAISGGLALWRRAVDDLLLGFGGLILGVWGIRAVLTSQPLPGITAIDVALCFVILFLLLGLAIKTLWFLHHRPPLR